MGMKNLGNHLKGDRTGPRRVAGNRATVAEGDRTGAHRPDAPDRALARRGQDRDRAQSQQPVTVADPLAPSVPDRFGGDVGWNAKRFHHSQRIGMADRPAGIRPTPGPSQPGQGPRSSSRSVVVPAGCRDPSARRECGRCCKPATLISP